MTPRTTPPTRVRGIEPDASVAALIPHFACEAWLDDALESLHRQTRPVQQIIVIDDASPDTSALTSLAARHPDVTFVTAERNCGPYALIGHVMATTAFDAYLFQDADDWSAPDRLEQLLASADIHGAALVGTSELRVLSDAGEVMRVDYPLDVNAALEADPGRFALLHPTSLVSSELVGTIGGYSTGLRFSGDAEFLARAVHAARVVNTGTYSYHRRKRTGSLTTAPGTGLGSPARLALHEDLRRRAQDRQTSAAAGTAVDLAPYATADTDVHLTHLAGPELRTAEPAVRS